MTRVPGIGPTKADALVAWAQTVARSFRFDPAKGIDPATLAQFEGKHARERVTNRAQLVGGAQVLRSIRDHTLQGRPEAHKRVQVAAERYGQAAADAAIPRAAYRC